MAKRKNAFKTEDYNQQKKARFPVNFVSSWVVNPDAFSIDTYAGCENHCKYCFTLGKGSSFFHHREDVQPMPFNEIYSRLTRITTKGVTLPYNEGRFQAMHWGFNNCTYTIGCRYDSMPSIESEIQNTYKTIQIFSGKHLIRNMARMGEFLWKRQRSYLWIRHIYRRENMDG